MQNKKYILGLVILFALFLSFGKVFADLQIPNRAAIQDAYLLKKYGSSTYSILPRLAPRSVYIFGGTNRINSDAWDADQAAIDAEYKKEVSQYQSYVESLINAKTSLNDNSLGDAGTISSLQEANDSLVLQIKDLQSKNDELSKENSALETQLGAKASAKTPVKVEPKKETPATSMSVPASVPVQGVIAPVVETPAATPAPVQRGFWARVLEWFGLR